jgi:hypothetical protein
MRATPARCIDSPSATTESEIRLHDTPGGTCIGEGRGLNVKILYNKTTLCNSCPVGLGDKFNARTEPKAAAAAEVAHQREVAAASAQANLVHELLDYMRLSEATDDVPGVMLKAGEVAYLVVQGAAFVEPKRAPGQWKGQSQGTSIHVAKGVRYRVGGSNGTFQQGEERPTPTDTGTFLITNQRFMFVGSKRTTERATPS